MRIIKNRAYYLQRSRCLHCGKVIEYGEVCLLLRVIYYYRGNAAVKLHLRCIEPFIKSLRNFKKESAKEILRYKLEG